MSNLSQVLGEGFTFRSEFKDCQSRSKEITSSKGVQHISKNESSGFFLQTEIQQEEKKETAERETV